MSQPSRSHIQPSVAAPGGVLLISCYELGQQPLALVNAAAALKEAGFTPSLMDLAVESLDPTKVAAAGLVSFSAPMHTAMRLAIPEARRIRELNPECHINFFGLYAELNQVYLKETVADTCLGAEFETELIDLCRSLDQGSPAVVGLPSGKSDKHWRSLVPDRSGLPNLEQYVTFSNGDQKRTVGYVTTTRGCKHLCLHCPIPPVYGGRFYTVRRDAVLEDIHRLVELGAQHITFGDPDFLNGPGHALRVARSVHEKYADVSFDYTAKISHLAEHSTVVEELASLGCAFVVSALESLSANTLQQLDKGHTADDIYDVVHHFKRIGLTLRPSLLPFTPWDTMNDYVALLDFIERKGLVDSTDPVQYSIRLLLPPGSPLLELPSVRKHIGAFEPARLTHTWKHPDPRMDKLHEEVSRIVDTAARADEDPAMTFFRIRRLAANAQGDETSRFLGEDVRRRFPSGRRMPPALSENWFC